MRFQKVHFIMVLVCLSLVLFVWWLFSNRDYPITNVPPRGDTIVAFGDSLVYGTGSSGGGFVSVLEERLQQTIINEGVPGDTTEDALVRLDTIVAHQPDITLVLLGGNDTLRRMPRESTLANLRTITTSLQSEGSVVVLLGVRGGLVGDGGFARELETLARETGALYVSDVLGGLFGDAAYMSDTVHPNDAGYVIIAGRIEEVLRTHVLD